jgi:hypothetical protein
MNMNIKKYILFSDTLFSNNNLKSFYTTSYGFELMLKLYDQSQSETNMHIDELYAKLNSGLPRREAFGKYINRLDTLGYVKKITHSQKKSMKSIVLCENIIAEIDKVFEL